jgi:hypothetical protein
VNICGCGRRRLDSEEVSPVLWVGQQRRRCVGN